MSDGALSGGKCSLRKGAEAVWYQKCAQRASLRIRPEGRFRYAGPGPGAGAPSRGHRNHWWREEA